MWHPRARSRRSNMADIAIILYFHIDITQERIGLETCKLYILLKNWINLFTVHLD